VGLLRHNVGLNRALAARKQIQIRFQPEMATLRVVIDAAKIVQVLNNLVGNAIKFSPALTQVDVLLSATASTAIIAVDDHGPGIPPNELAKLFKPFSKTSVRSTAGEKSTGLGLAIVRRIAEGHGGEVQVESEVGRGSRFLVRLPR
jgi:signal transduction histidine kinase